VQRRQLVCLSWPGKCIQSVLDVTSAGLIHRQHRLEALLFSSAPGGTGFDQTGVEQDVEGHDVQRRHLVCPNPCTRAKTGKTTSPSKQL